MLIEPDKYCSKCDRLKGFRDANIADPLAYQSET